MAGQIEIPYYDESVPLKPVPGNTPFGYYDADLSFQSDGPKFAKFSARRLGYPIMEVELQDVNFYAALEDAVTVYGRELYEYKIRDNYLSLEGNQTGSVLNESLLQPNFGNMMRIAEDYAAETAAGGNLTYYTGSIFMHTGYQDYDLNVWASASASLEPGDSIEIKRVYYEAPPAIVRYFDPYAGTGTGLQSLMEAFGFGQFSPGINFMLMPVYFDVLKIQSIEFNDQIRKSAYGFQIINNQLKIFPVPTFDQNLFFTYIKVSERNKVVRDNRQNLITNVSNVPFIPPVYSHLNTVAKKWIFDYAFAVVKETLGNIRGLYATIPVPGSEATLNGPSLIDQSRAEKDALITQLRDTLDSTSRQKQLERRAAEAESMKQTFTNFPLPIYIY